MNEDPSSRPSKIIEQAGIDRLLIEAVAQMRVTETSEIEKEFSENGGDLEMDTQEAMPVIANVESVLGCTLPGIENLKPGKPVSIRALSELIERSLSEVSRKQEGMSMMIKVISESNLSLGWLAALEYLLRCGGRATHLHVGIEDVSEENVEIRYLLDKFIEFKGEYPVSSVANTVFPAALYYPDNPRLKGSKARHHLYQMYQQGDKVRQRHPANKFGTYFNRMIDWPSGRKTVNQLERIIDRLQSNRTRNNPLSSNYELSVGGSEECFVQDDTADIQIRLPGTDTSIMGFPCLSHISFVLDKGRLSMTALYRNQHFIRKAYGNYLGLSRLLRFICQEAGCETGELVCIASHADAEFNLGKRDILKLVKDCREAAQHSQMAQTLT